ncbi:hypothetical protein EW026_g5079 [Hermanssonia centrifuga]|uniref:TFIIS N-terminal domain-containing protein n=1 Tax=Hermanssonia centrifuga TaxID=98765 RepID=A0A4S4KF48_9APHY|nr:hypothetical protein EW026_g5079 [Hermanssonia centrifuga]
MSGNVKQEAELEREIFGSDSELSEAEQDSDVPSAGRPHKHRSPAGEEAESSGESGDDYVQEKRAQKPRRKTRRKEDGAVGGRATQKKRKRPQVVEQDLSQLPPEEASKIRLDMQIEAILKPKKGSRPKKRKKDADEDVLDRAADEEVSRLREAMLSAAADDEQANREKLPAISKLKLLPQVMDVLRRTALAQSIIDNNLLEGVRRWLEPLPDRSLPALDIQKEFFPILKKMEFIDTNVLKESKLGRVVVFYTKCKRVAPDISRLANDLVSTWSRPIIKRSASYRDRAIETITFQNADGGRGGERLNAILARAREGERNRVRKNAVAIPSRELGSYTVAPQANSGILKQNVSVDVDIERRKKNAERLRLLTRKISARP